MGIPDAGVQTDPINRRGSGSCTYTVCEAGAMDLCTNAAQATF